MHWNTGYMKRPQRKTVRRFALIPRVCENHHIHWLEMVDINKRLIGGTYSTVDAYDNYDPDIFHCKCSLVSEIPDDLKYEVKD